MTILDFIRGEIVDQLDAMGGGKSIRILQVVFITVHGFLPVTVIRTVPKNICTYECKWSTGRAAVAGRAEAERIANTPGLLTTHLELRLLREKSLDYP